VYKNLCKNEPISTCPSHKKAKFEIWAIYPPKSRKLRLAAQSFENAKTAILSPLSLYLADMNSHNSFNGLGTVPPEYVPPMSLHRFCEITGLSKVSAWRYEKRGWLRTHLIANRRYILAADVAEFNRSPASDEFAGSVSNLFRAHSTRSKERK